MYIKRNQATTVAEVVELNTGIKAEEFIKPCKLPFIKNIKEAKEKEVPINIILPEAGNGSITFKTTGEKRKKKSWDMILKDIKNIWIIREN